MGIFKDIKDTFKAIFLDAKNSYKEGQKIIKEELKKHDKEKENLENKENK